MHRVGKEEDGEVRQRQVLPCAVSTQSVRHTVVLDQQAVGLRIGEAKLATQSSQGQHEVQHRRTEPDASLAVVAVAHSELCSVLDRIP